MIKAKTTYTKENVLELQKFQFKSQTKYRIVLTVLGIIVCISAIQYIFNKNYVEGIPGLVLGIYIFGYLYSSVVPKIQTNYVLKSDRIMIGLENHFTFSKKYIEIIDKYSTARIPYDIIYAYYETKNYFYIYLNNVKVYIVGQEDIEDGKIEELRNLLNEKVKRK